MDRSKPRQAWLDGLKGFAILLVILGHVLSGYLDAGTFPSAYDSFLAVRSWIYSFHMPLFFLISGYTFSLAYYRDGHLRRQGYFCQLFNLLWIYVLFAVVQWLVKQAVPELVNETYTVDDLRRMFVAPLGNFWYIYVLFVLYGIAALTGLPNRHPRWLLFLAGASIVVCDCRLDWTNLTLYRIIYHFFFFAMGSALYEHRAYLESKKLLGVAAMVLSAAAYYYVFWYVRSWYANWKVAIAAATSFVLVYLFHRCRRLSSLRLFQICGKHCLELYLLHTFFTAGLRSLLPVLGIVTPWASALLNFALSTAVCLAIARLADRARVLDLVFRPARFFRRIRVTRSEKGKP